MISTSALADRSNRSSRSRSLSLNWSRTHRTKSATSSSLAANLPLPEFDVGGDFTNALNGARDGLPGDLGEVTGVLDGDLARFGILIEELSEFLQDSVKIAGAIERLVAIDFSCPATSGGSGAGGVGGGSPPAPANTGANRMARTAEQTQQVNDMLDRLPASPTVGGLLEFFFPIIDNKSHDKLFQLTLPVVDDVVEPLRTLSRWAAMDATAVGGEIESTITSLTAHLRAAARNPLDALTTNLGALEPQLALPDLTTFADAYALALNDLVSAIESAVPGATTAPVAALNLALDNAATTLTAWDTTVAANLEALCRRLHDFAAELLDRISHLLTLLEPVELPNQLVGAIASPQAPDAAAVTAVQEAVQPILDWLNDAIGLLDFSSIQGEVGAVATEAQGIADSVQQGLTGVALQVQSLFDQVGAQLSVLNLTGLRDQLDTQISEFGNNLERQLGNAFTPASDALATAVTTLSDALDNFDPEEIIDALRGVLQAITDVLQSGEVADAIEQVKEAIATVTSTLEQLSFTPVTDEVVALIEQMTDALRDLQDTDLNDAAKAALAVALEVLPDDLQPVTDPLLEELDDLIEQGPVPLLERVAEKPAELLDSITRFKPGDLIGDKLSGPYRAALDRAESFKPGRLFEAIDGELSKAKQSLVQQASPGRALSELNGPFEQLKGELQRYSPDTLLQPLEDKVEAVIARVVEASPVDEIFEQVDRVFALINDALSVPQNLVATLQRINTLLGHLADSGQQVDQWRDGMLDKVIGVTNLPAITAALADLNSALSDAAHAELVSRFDNQTLALRNALTGFNPGAWVNALVTAHNRANSLAAGLADSPEKSALQAALVRFDPGRAAPLRLTRELQQCLEQTRAALEDLQSEWQELVESPEGALSEIASVTADAGGLRTLVAQAVEPLLAPLRYLSSLLESLQPAVNGMLTTLTDLVGQLTASVGALTTGPASLQSISDAVQQVVDTLRNIDLGFLRESLQRLFVQLLDQLEALNPTQLGDTLDEAFERLLDSIGLDQVIPPASIAALDASYDATLDKLRALDPEQLVTEVVQPEYDAAVGPLVEAFDLTPAFNALIEFLRSLNDELDGELGRVNTAYQGLRGARPSLGDINVNISF